jgi:long-chain acyl-CoA synthetase
MIPRTIGDLPFDAARRDGHAPALRYRAGGDWVDQSYVELAATVRAAALGLIRRGVAPGDRVAILCDTRPEWTWMALGAIAAGAIVVPVYPSSTVPEVQWILGDSGATLAVCENAAQLAKVGAAAAELVAAPPSQRSTPAAVTVDPAGVSTVYDLIADGRSAGAQPGGGDEELDRRRAAIDPAQPCLIIYTSGTTGPPKGCMLTHHNWLHLCAIAEQVNYVGAGDVVYLFLPLAHVFAQLVQFGCFYSGATLAYYGGDPRRIIPELAEIRPTFLPSVPRIFEKLYTAFTAGTDPGWLREAVREGLAARLSGTTPAAEGYFAKVRAALGGRLRLALTGAAPIAVEVLEFFFAAGVPVMEGYGMTESTAVGGTSTLDRYRLGTVGVAAPGVEIKLAHDGEILMAGPHVFAGYWRNPEATAASIVDGWLHTGDLGTLDDDGFLTITGRKKDIIITSGGKNIAPAGLENALRQSRWISQAVMVGDRRPYPVALVTLDAEEILPWARERGLPADLAELARHPAVHELIAGVVDEANAGYADPLRIKRFAILDRDFTVDAGELTPTLKLKRAVVHANHAETIEELYAQR